LNIQLAFVISVLSKFDYRSVHTELLPQTDFNKRNRLIRTLTKVCGIRGEITAAMGL
jgi:hypothetical protein